jgi:hypothetical protein
VHTRFIETVHPCAQCVTYVLTALSSYSALSPQPRFGLQPSSASCQPSAEEGATIASWLSTGAMLINPTDSMPYSQRRFVEDSIVQGLLLFLVAEFVGFHSRGDGDDSFVGP